MKRILLAALLLPALAFAQLSPHQLPGAQPLSGGEIFAADQGLCTGCTVGVTTLQLQAYFNANLKNLTGVGTAPALILNGSAAQSGFGDFEIISNTANFGGILLTTSTATQEFVALRNLQNVPTSFSEVALQGGSGTDNASLIMTNPNWPAGTAGFTGLPAGQAFLISAVPGTNGAFPIAFGTNNKLRMLMGAAGNISVFTADSGPSFTVGNTSGANSFTVAHDGSVAIASPLTLSGVTGTAQCLQASATGVVSGTGVLCGSGGGSGGTPGTPTALVGLTAVHGSLSTFMPSDAAPALNQGISPNWVGNHTFSPASGAGVTINGASGAFSEEIFNSGATSNGLQVQAGTSASDNNVIFNSKSGIATWAWAIQGDGGFFSTAATGGNKGVGTFNAVSLFANGSPVPAVNQSPIWSGNHVFAPVSGTAVVVDVPPSNVGVQVNLPAAFSIGLNVIGAAATQLDVLNMQESGQHAWLLAEQGSGNGLFFQDTTTGIVPLQIDASNGVTTNVRLIADGSTTGSVLRANNSTDSAVSFLSNGLTHGIRFEHGGAGSSIDGVDSTGTGSFQPIEIQGTTVGLLATGAGTGLNIGTDGGVVIGTPAGGDLGPGILNTQGIAINGVAVGGFNTAISPTVTGAWNFAPSVAGSTAITIEPPVAGFGIQQNMNANASNNMRMQNFDTTDSAAGSSFQMGDGTNFAGFLMQNAGWTATVPTNGVTGLAFDILASGNFPIELTTNGVVRESISGAGNVLFRSSDFRVHDIASGVDAFIVSSGNVLIPGSSSGPALTVNNNAGTTASAGGGIQNWVVSQAAANQKIWQWSASSVGSVGNVSLTAVPDSGVAGTSSAIAFARSGSSVIDIIFGNTTDNPGYNFTGTGPLLFPNAVTTTASPAAGGAGALPATPAGYFTIVIDGVSRRVPFY